MHSYPRTRTRTRAYVWHESPSLRSHTYGHTYIHSYAYILYAIASIAQSIPIDDSCMCCASLAVYQSSFRDCRQVQKPGVYHEACWSVVVVDVAARTTKSPLLFLSFLTYPGQALWISSTLSQSDLSQSDKHC